MFPALDGYDCWAYRLGVKKVGLSVIEMYCAPPVCYKSEMEVYGLSVMKSNFISFTLTGCTRRVSGVGVQLEVEWRCVSVFTKGVSVRWTWTVIE